MQPGRAGPYFWGTLTVENILLSEKIQIERKQFFFDLKENPRGRFLRITEDVYMAVEMSSGRRGGVLGLVGL